jgi:DNA-binding IclR family transcriptional regulator
LFVKPINCSIMQNTTRDPLARAFQLLRWFTGEQLESIGVREAAAALSIAPSTAHNLLAALTAEGVLAQDEQTGRYTLGFELFHLAHRAMEQVPLRRLAMPHLRKLVGACNEAAHLSLYVRQRAELVTIAGVESTHPVRYVIEMYSWRPLHVGASGRAVLAFLPADEGAALLAGQRGRSADLAREIEAVRERGYALTAGTRIQGAVGLAAPLFDAAGAVLGAVGIALPAQRFDAAAVERLAKPLLACARNLTAEIAAAPMPGRRRTPPPATRRKLAHAG